jgi:hypothetical protein
MYMVLLKGYHHMPKDVTYILCITDCKRFVCIYWFLIWLTLQF